MLSTAQKIILVREKIILSTEKIISVTEIIFFRAGSTDRGTEKIIFGIQRTDPATK